MRTKSGTPRIVATAMWGRDDAETLARLSYNAVENLEECEAVVDCMVARVTGPSVAGRKIAGGALDGK